MYQPLITFCPHPAIFTQVLRIFVGRMRPLAQKGQRGAAENAWRSGCPLAMPC